MIETHSGGYLAHGVVILYFAGHEESMAQAIQVLKMRGLVCARLVPQKN